MENNLVEHHTKYKEIDGVDETIWMTPSEHIKLHKRLRKENKCNVPPDELRKISNKAYTRTDKCKKIISKMSKKYRQTEQYKNNQKQREIDIIERFRTSNVVAPNISLSEEIVHNKNTRTIFVISRFVGNHGIKLITKEI